MTGFTRQKPDGHQSLMPSGDILTSSKIPGLLSKKIDSIAFNPQQAGPETLVSFISGNFCACSLWHNFL